VAIKLKLPDDRRSVRSAPRPVSRGAKGKNSQSHHFSLEDPLVKLLVSSFVIAGILLIAFFAYFYVKYERIVDRRMAVLETSGFSAYSSTWQ